MKSVVHIPLQICPNSDYGVRSTFPFVWRPSR